ncbi:hypothetical protein EZY14_002640 [Kordia sp. TARA_039_SRF]|nr:hypothetical protein EZY14_002640 [Kordia sp. TARA_039_SRF]
MQTENPNTDAQILEAVAQLQANGDYSAMRKDVVSLYENSLKTNQNTANPHTAFYGFKTMYNFLTKLQMLETGEVNEEYLL